MNTEVTAKALIRDLCDGTASSNDPKDWDLKCSATDLIKRVKALLDNQVQPGDKFAVHTETSRTNRVDWYIADNTWGDEKGVKHIKARP